MADFNEIYAVQVSSATVEAIFQWRPIQFVHLGKPCIRAVQADLLRGRWDEPEDVSDEVVGILLFVFNFKMEC